MTSQFLIDRPRSLFHSCPREASTLRSSRLRIGTKLDRYRETARMVLEPWIVEAALARFAEKRLTPEEQEIVLKATRTPAKVRWPDWWVVMP